MITGLINCELDDWVEMSNSELKNKYLYSRHSSNESTALKIMPKIPSSFHSDENSDNETDVENDDTLSKRKFSDLEQRLIETQAELQEKNSNSVEI